jgi:hypothetical protein
MTAAAALNTDSARVLAVMKQLEADGLVTRADGVIPRYSPVDLLGPALKHYFAAENSGTFPEIRDQLLRQGVKSSKTGLGRALQALVDANVVVEQDSVFFKKPQLDRALADRIRPQLEAYFKATTQRAHVNGLLVSLGLQDQAGAHFAVRTVLGQLVHDRTVIVQKNPRTGEKLYQRFMTQEQLEEHRENQVEEHKQFVLDYLRDHPFEIVTRHRLRDHAPNGHFLRVALDELFKSQDVVEHPEDGARHTMPDGYRQFQSRLVINPNVEV